MFEAIGAGLTALRIGARLAGVKQLALKVPKPVWEAIAVLGYLAALFALHQHYANARVAQAVQTAIAARDQQWQQRLAQSHAQAIAWKGRADARTAEITRLQRKLTDEETRRIAADAAAVRLRGPGQATAPAGCRPGDHSGVPGIADRRNPQPGTAAHAGTEVSAADGQGQWAVVPWDWLVDVVSERDAFRVEAIGWRGWRASVAGTWQRMVDEAAQSQPRTKGKTDGR